MSKLKQANKQIASAVTGGYKTIEKSVAAGYKKIEDAFIDAFLAEDGETAEQAKARIIEIQARQKGGNNR